MPAFDSATAAVVSAAFDKLRAEIAVTTHLRSRLLAWLEQLAGSPRLETYFEHPYAYPLLELPLWVGESVGGPAADSEFLVDITFSNLCGYYFIRLLDDVMDADSATDPQLLAVATFLQVHIQRPYQRYFPGDHPFWDTFRAVCTLTADVTLRDADLKTVTAEDFRAIASQKVCGAKIPVAAACYRCGRPDLIPGWFRFVDSLGQPHQMLNDLMGWFKDVRHDRRTFLLSEAASGTEPGEPAEAWIVRTGVAWALSQVEGWLDDAAAAAPLSNRSALAFVEQRLATLEEVRGKVEPGLRALQTVLP